MLALRRVARRGASSASIALPVAGAVGWIVAGREGMWGALLGVAIPIAFLSVTVLVGLATSRLGTAALGVAVLGSWIGKIAVLITVLAAIRGVHGYSRPVFFVVLLISTAGYLLLETLTVLRTRMPYVEPVGKSA